MRIRSASFCVIWFMLLLGLIGCASLQPRLNLTPTPSSIPPTPTPVTITFFNGDLPSYELNDKIIQQFVAETGIQVEHRLGPESVTELLMIDQELLSNRSDEVDIYLIDVIWPGILAEHMLDLNEYLPEETGLHFQAILENNTVDGRLVGMPYYTDIGLLFYRTDLLAKYGYEAPPKTWSELEQMAATIQAGERAEGNLNFWGYVWQGAPYEGLTCDALEWQASSGGGRIIEPDGVISINNPQAIAAFERAAGWVGVISPPVVIGYKEEDSRSVWHVGNAAFLRNWPYAYARSQAPDSAVKGRFAVTQLPSGDDRSVGTLGGWQLSISKYSKHREEALRFIQYMTSPRIQLERSVQGSYLPTIPDLYDEPTILTANPYYADLKDILIESTVARPSTVSGPQYNQVSTIYFKAVHDILTGEAEAAEAVAELEAELVELTGFETGPPE